jgi:hypothetical protein
MVDIANYFAKLPKDLGLLKKDWQNAFLHFSL